MRERGNIVSEEMGNVSYGYFGRTVVKMRAKQVLGAWLPWLLSFI